MKNQQLIQSYETEIRSWWTLTLSKLDAGRSTILEAANDGAVLGAHIAEWRSEAGVSNDAEFWNGLSAIVPAAKSREDVVRFALRAAQLKKRAQAELTDFSQLTFALALPGEEAHSDGPPVRRETNEMMLATRDIMRLNGFITEWMEKVPVAKWDPVVKSSLREQLRPLVELFNRLG